MTLVTRPPMTDDSGTFTDGTAINKAFVDSILDEVDTQVHSATNPTRKPKDTTDEVVTARGSKASLDARLDVALNEDGTPKAVAGQATETQVGREQGNANLVRNSGLNLWTDGAALAPDHYVLSGTLAAIVRSGTGESDTTHLDAGSFTAKLTSGSATLKLTQTLLTAAEIGEREKVEGRKIQFSAIVKASAASVARLVVDDGSTTTPGAFHPGGDTAELLTATHTLSASSTKLDVYVEVAASSNIAYVTGLQAIFSDVVTSLWMPQLSPWSAGRYSIVARNVTAAGNSGSGETDLHSVLGGVPANALAQNGQAIRVSGRGSLNANTNAKTLRLYFGSTVIATVLVSSANVANNVFAFTVTFVRFNSTTVLVYGQSAFDVANGAAAPTLRHISASVGGLSFTISNALKLTGQGTATDDIQLAPWLVEFLG